MCTSLSEDKPHICRRYAVHSMLGLCSFLIIAALPSDIIMACRKQHNGSPSRYGLIVCVDVDVSTKIDGDFAQALQEWIWDSLDRAHRALDLEVGWKFVCNVYADQREDSDSDSDSEPNNGYQVCVHIEPDRSSRKGPLLWYSPQHTVQTPVDPSAVLAHFTAPLRQVRAVSVSGVNNTTLRDEWKDCCATVPNCFDRAGQGYNAHPMFLLPARSQADTLPRMFAQRETSFRFGWPDYTPYT